MTTYTEVFGGDTVPPSDNKYAAVSLTADTTFYWPEQASGSTLMADIMEVTPSAAYAMTFPAANSVSSGRDVLVRNLGAYTITLKDSTGGTIGTVAAGVAKYLYITDNSTAAGAWTIFTFGTGTSAADAATLAGYGLLATGSTLSQSSITVSSAITNTIAATNRAETMIFTNSGVVTCNLPAAATVGNGFFVNISNQGTGTVTIDPSGAETIDGGTTKDLAPGESLTAVCSGVLWATVGYGRSTQFQFTKLVLPIAVGSPFTLTSVQAANKLIQTTGIITADVTINVPAVVAVYYIECSHTGVFNTTFKTAAGTGVTLAAGDRSILYCDGVDVVSAQTASAPVANISGGAAGVVVYQSAAGATSFTAAGTTGQVLISGGTGAPTWSDIGLITNSYSVKSPPVDADLVPISDSAATNVGKKVLWSVVKSTLKTYFDTLYTAVSTCLPLTGGTLTGGVLFKYGLNNVASASPLVLTGINANTAHVTGTTGFSSLTMTSGQVIDLIFDGILTLTHHAFTNNLPGGANITTAAGDRARYWYDGTAVWCVAYVRADGTAVVAPATIKASPVRQTVLGGPVDTSGYPSFLPSTAGGLSITAQNISSTFPFVVTAAAGFSSAGAADRVGQTTSNNLTWGSLTNTTTNYLYVDVATDGTLSTGSTTLAPIYSFGGNTGGAPYTTSGQNVYNIQEGKMYVGPTPTQVYRVFVGEAVTSGGTVTSTVAYAYQGRYESGWTATLPSGVGTVSFNHNLGITQDSADIWIECTTNDGPFVVGDRIRNPCQTSSSIYPMPTFGGARNSMKWYSGSGNHLVPTSASFTLLTSANWKYKATAQRGW